jgi:hypothetical protein
LCSYGTAIQDFPIGFIVVIEDLRDVERSLAHNGLVTRLMFALFMLIILLEKYYRTLSVYSRIGIFCTNKLLLEPVYEVEV